MARFSKSEKDKRTIHPLHVQNRRQTNSLKQSVLQTESLEVCKQVPFIWLIFCGQMHEPPKNNLGCND